MPPSTPEQEFGQEQECGRAGEHRPQLEPTDRGGGAGRRDRCHAAGHGLVEQASGCGGEFGESAYVGGAGAQFIAGGEEDRAAGPVPASASGVPAWTSTR